MKSGYKVNKYIRAGFYMVSAVVLMIFFCAQCVLPSERDLETAPGDLVYGGTFFWEKEDGTREQIEVPGDYDIEPGTVMAVTTTLPEDYDETSLCIRSSQQNVRFYIDGELRSEYDTKDTRLFGLNSASRYVFCETSAADAGRELRIELVSHSGRYSGVVNELLCGDKADIWVSVSNDYGGKLVIALFLLFSGIVAVVFSIVLSIVYKTRYEMEYLGVCMIMGATWMLGESRLRQLIVPNASTLASLCFVVVMLCPIPILFYVDTVQGGRYRKLLGVIEGVAALNFLVSTILQVAGVADYLDTLMIAHIILFITFFATFATFFLEYRQGRSREHRLVLLGLLIAMIGTFLEAMSVWFVVYATGIFLGTGLFVLLILTTIKTTMDIRDIKNRQHQAQLDERRRQMESMSLQTMRTLSILIEEKDEYTQGHSYRVAEYAARIAERMGWSEKEVDNLKNAALLHDVGKIGVPGSILNKPTRLLDSEYDIVKRHTVVGADIVKNITLIDHVEEVTRYHHERYDGKGYPEGLSGEEIPIHARIVAVADSYDAMNSRRIYRDPLPQEVIRKEILKNRGIQFDPDIADIALGLMDEGRMQIDEEGHGGYADSKEIGVDKTMETGRFISGVVEVMKNQKDIEGRDYLTGLPMRSQGEKQMAQLLQDHGGCLVFIDMDNLKKINDIYGHKAGDRVLKLLGDTIAECGGNTVACRFGGDEFLLFLPDVTEEAAKAVDGVFYRFHAKKEEDVAIRSASLSGGLCLCGKGDSFADCYAKADKALYYVKQKGKNGYAFYHQIEKESAVWKNAEVDLTQLVKSLRESGNYNGALNLDNREFAKIYEYVSNLGERYQHNCHLLMITLDAVSDNTIFIETIEEALSCMEAAIRQNIRTVDICTRYSSMQYLVILMEAGEENIPRIMERVMAQYFKTCSGNDFYPRYEYISMQDADAS